MRPGEYQYEVSGGSPGRIVVRDHRQEKDQEYARLLETTHLVQIDNGRPDPPTLSVVAGQTVVWLVGEGGGVAISSSPQPRVGTG